MRADPETVDLMLLRAQFETYNRANADYTNAAQVANKSPQYPYLREKALALAKIAQAEGKRLNALFDAVNLPADHKPTPAKRTKPP